MLLLVACSTPPEASPPPASTTKPRADVTLRAVTVRHYRGSELRVVATSPTLELMRGSNEFSAADASIFLAHSGVSVLTPRIDGNAVSQVATGSGGVLLVGNDGMVGRTDHATFDRSLGAEGGALSDAGVTLEHQRFELRASGFAVDLAEQKATFDAPVTTTKE